VPGHNASHEQKCLTVLNFDKSGPTSAMTLNAVAEPSG
jgi:hypothetical protein